MTTTPAVLPSTNRNQVSASANAGVINGIAAAQSLAGAGALNLNGSLVQAGQQLPGGPAPVAQAPNPGWPGNSSPATILTPSSGLPTIGSAAVLTPAQAALITSAGNDAGLTWTISGYDRMGTLITETVAGSASPVTSQFLYSQVNSITANGATASTVQVGTSGTVFSDWLILGHQRNNYTTNLRAFISGASATYAVQATSDINLMNEYGGYADDIAVIGASGSVATTIALVEPWIGVRLQVTAGGPVVLRALESRTA